MEAPTFFLSRKEFAPNLCPCEDFGRILLDEGSFAAPSDLHLAESYQRSMQEDPQEAVKVWEVVYMCIVLLIMFAALISDKVGADMVMLAGVTLCMAAGIISVEEGIAGFANKGLLTVMVLFVVAAGISLTGALDWYMGKLLGTPASTASAQLRLMIPISIVSAFLNNTPVVAVMIPIIQRWGKNIGISPQQLLIPLSFASILGGTCTLIGTSTNLVVVGLLSERYEEPPTIGLFDLGQFGVPIGIAGIAYILVASPFLLPGSERRGSDETAPPPDDGESILLGARLTKWSPAAGRSVRRSGLRDTGGIYLVSVHRAATGNVHRAVGPDFVLNVDDNLYFTGLVESFGEFCEEHGLEVVTNEVEDKNDAQKENEVDEGSQHGDVDDHVQERERVVQFSDQNEVFDEHHEEKQESVGSLDVADRQQLVDVEMPPIDVIDVSGENIGLTKESCVNADVQDRMRAINRMTDIVRGIKPAPTEDELAVGRKLPEGHPSTNLDQDKPAKVVIVVDTSDKVPLVLVGINARDRPGLLLDISKGLLRLGIQLRHSEASVVEMRSMSIWRCEILEGGVTNEEEIWDVMSALLEHEHGIEAIKRRGLNVLRAAVTSNSFLIGKTATEAAFRNRYKAALVAIQKDGKNTASFLSETKFESGDVLVLQTEDDSPLLVRPPSGFYKRQEEDKAKFSSIVSNLAKRFSRSDLLSEDASPPSEIGEREFGSKKANDRSPEEDGYFIASLHDSEMDLEAQGSESSLIGNLETLGVDTDNNEHKDKESIWQDLRVFFHAEGTSSSGDQRSREFLAAMEISPKSQLANKTVSQSGINTLPGVTLVSIERPVSHASSGQAHSSFMRFSAPLHDGSSRASSIRSIDSVDESSITDTVATKRFMPISTEEVVQVGDVIWFAGKSLPNLFKRYDTSLVPFFDSFFSHGLAPFLFNIINGTGSANAVGDLRKIPGMRSYESEEVAKINEKVYDRRLVQAVIARKGPLVGKNVKDVRFRTRYGAAVIAVHREGKRVHQHPGKIKLQSGDVLLLEAGPAFISANANNSRAFTLLSEVEDSAPPRLSHLLPALFLTILMLAVFTAQVTDLLVCGLVAAILMVCFGILSQQEARDAVNWEIYTTIACAFGIGTALTNSGVAGGVAIFLVRIGEAIGIGSAGLFGSVYFATFLISNVVTNNAAAALIFPIGMDAAEQTGTDITLMSYCIMLGASASFMSPFGYTTNIMVYGPGGYKVRKVIGIVTGAVVDVCTSFLSHVLHAHITIFFSRSLIFHSTKTFSKLAHRCNLSCGYSRSHRSPRVVRTCHGI